MKKISLFDCIETQGQTSAGKLKKITACPLCYERGNIEEISTRAKKFGFIPVLVNYLCESGCKPQRDQRKYNDANPKKREFFERYDVTKIREIASGEIPYWYPKNPMIKGRETCVKRDLEGQGVKTVADLFTSRSLWALASLLEMCKETKLALELLYVFQSNILSATIMQQYREAGGGFAKGTYYVPQIFIEREQLGCFSRKLNDIISAQNEIQAAIQGTGVPDFSPVFFIEKGK